MASGMKSSSLDARFVYECVFFLQWQLLLLRGEIVAPNHYYPLGVRPRRQGQHLITPKTELLSLAYFTTTI